MNRKIGYGAVTTTGLVTVDKEGRTARHFTGRVRVDYMCDNHFWVIIDQIEGFGDSIPTIPLLPAALGVDEFCDKGKLDSVDLHDTFHAGDVGEIWIPDHNVASIRWYERKW
jgi:hypothetical protein